VTSGRRRLAFGLLVAACALVAASAIALGGGGREPSVDGSAAARALPSARAERRPVVVFRSLGRQRSSTDGQVAVASLGDPSGRRTLLPLRCDRVHFAGGRGLCVARGAGFAAGYRAKLFRPDGSVSHELSLEGVPSRARVSGDGRYGSVTMFEAGHSYADAGAFSTETTLIDMASGRRIADLEDFAVTRAGRLVTAVDVNFWGVTFARDSDRFYATLATGGKTYLLEGSVQARTARVIHENVECPSLSPDGTRVAYKRRTGVASRPWRLTVLDLSTMRETAVGEPRSIDDQVEWLDDGRLLYGVDRQVMVARADGGGRPHRYIALAESPAVVRW
jgi:hypothetical protein